MLHVRFVLTFADVTFELHRFIEFLFKYVFFLVLCLFEHVTTQLLASCYITPWSSFSIRCTNFISTALALYIKAWCLQHQKFIFCISFITISVLL